MASVDAVAGGTLGSINLAAFSANIFLPALTAQIDLAIGLGLGPLKFDLATQFNATLSAQASIALSVGNPLAAIQAALVAVAQLQASLSLALSLPPIQLSLSAELSATAALAASLSAKLGLIDGMISAALAVKLPAINFSLGLGGALSVGPAILLGFNGIADGTDMAAMGDLIRTKMQSPVTFGGDTINPGDNVSGILLLTTVDEVFTALSILFSGL